MSPNRIRAEWNKYPKCLPCTFLALFTSLSPTPFGVIDGESKNTMWPEEIHCPMVVGLSEMDKLVPVQPIRRFLLSHPSLYRTTPISPPGSVSSSEVGKRTKSGRSLGNGSIDEDSGVKRRSRGQASRPGCDQEVLIDWKEQGEATTEAGTFDADGEVPRRVEVLFWPGHVHGTTMVDPSALEDFDRVCRRQEQAFVVKRVS